MYVSHLYFRKVADVVITGSLSLVRVRAGIHFNVLVI